MNYSEFLAAKAQRVPLRGIERVPDLPSHLFGFQAHCVDFGLRAGSWGCYLGTGMGKSRIQMAWAQHAAEHANGSALILTPLAVARQMEVEALGLGYDARVIRDQSQARHGVNICNYDRLGKLDPDAFGAVAFDESSVVKAFIGTVARGVIDAFSRHRFRLAASATPAPNDHMELGQQAELVGAMARDQMLMRWFMHDSGNTSQWRLKGHAVAAFWDWMASWSRMADHPRDLGDDVAGFDLPPLNIVRHHADVELSAPEGSLFADTTVSATTLHDVKRQTIAARAELAASLVDERESWLIWCDTDYEADALMEALPDGTVEVRGSHSIDRKEDALAAFSAGSARRLVTKPKVAGWGLNFQHCHNMIFVGRSFSFEAWHQAVRRCWRFGQRHPVTCHLIVADGEDAIGRVIDRKAADHERMRAAMREAMARAIGSSALARVPYSPKHFGRLPGWLMERAS